MIVISSNHRLEPSGRPYVYMKCNRGHLYQGEGRVLSVEEREATKTKACGCGAGIRIDCVAYPTRT